MKFAVDVVRFSRSLGSSVEIDVIKRQLVSAGTGVGANYRAAGRSRSDSEWCSRLAVVVEEADESDYWLTLMDATGIGQPERRRELQAEARELTALFTTSLRTSRQKLESAAASRRTCRPIAGTRGTAARF